MGLCGHRPEGFGPYSSISHPLPTSCFTDTILIPLPVWLFLLTIPILYLLHRRTTPVLTGVKPKKTRWWKVAEGTYYVFIVLNILMETLEIVRLALLHYGVGLIPFVYVGLIGGGIMHLTNGFGGQVPYWAWANLVLLWIGGFVMTIVKIAGLAMDSNQRKGSKYPLSDQLTDVGVVAGVYVVIGVLEVVLAGWRRRTVGGVKSTESLRSFSRGGEEGVERTQFTAA